MKIYYRGPATSFTYPLSDDGEKSITFKRKGPGEKPETVAKVVNKEVAEELLTRRGHHFYALDSAEGEKITGGEEEGDDTPPPISPSISVLVASENAAEEDRGAKLETSLPRNSPTVRGAEKKV